MMTTLLADKYTAYHLKLDTAPISNKKVNNVNFNPLGLGHCSITHLSIFQLLCFNIERSRFEATTKIYESSTVNLGIAHFIGGEPCSDYL